MRASEEGAAAAAPAPGSGTPTRRQPSRPGRLRVVYSCAALDTVDGEASGLECALRRLGVTDEGSGRGPAGGTGKLQPAFGRSVLPSPGASSSGGSGDSAWDVLSNCSSCGSPRGEPRHRRTGSCPVFGGGGTLGDAAAAARPPPLWLRRGRGRGPMVDVLDGLPDLGVVERQP